MLFFSTANAIDGASPNRKITKGDEKNEEMERAWRCRRSESVICKSRFQSTLNQPQMEKKMRKPRRDIIKEVVNTKPLSTDRDATRTPCHCPLPDASIFVLSLSERLPQ